MWWRIHKTLRVTLQCWRELRSIFCDWVWAGLDFRSQGLQFPPGEPYPLRGWTWIVRVFVALGGFAGMTKIYELMFCRELKLLLACGKAPAFSLPRTILRMPELSTTGAQTLVAVEIHKPYGTPLGRQIQCKVGQTFNHLAIDAVLNWPPS